MSRNNIDDTKSKRRKLNITEDEVVNNVIPSVVMNQGNRLDRDFYNVPCETLAKALLRKILVRRLDCGALLKGRIVETECYLGGEDKASHTFNGRRTKGNEPMYMAPGTAYVYFTYGMYHCFNISSDGPGAAVLLRAVEPLLGMEKMQEYRKTKKRKKELKVHELCNGPSKLCISFNINKTDLNKADLTVNEHMWIEDDFQEQNIQIVTTSRIGIDSAGEEWASKPLRFYILGNANVSRRDKIVEQMIIDRS